MQNLQTIDTHGKPAGVSGTTMKEKTMSSLFNTDDGWADAANDYADKLLCGKLIKCTDGHWTVGRDSTDSILW
jgi:hypothetical protein